MDKDIRTKFGKSLDERLQLIELRKLKQAPNMTVHYFGEMIKRGAEDSYPPGVSLIENYVQHELIEIFLKGLNSARVRDRIIIKNSSTLDLAISEAVKESLTKNRLDLYKLSTPPALAFRDEEPMDTSILVASTHSQLEPFYEEEVPIFEKVVAIRTIVVV